MKHIKMKYGFTLIELLVVVIIIAVLSAVALPMYKHAALKSRFSKVMPVAKSIVEAQEVYYLGKNIYAANDEKDLLDVSPSGDTTIELATRAQEDKYNYVAASSTEVPGARYIMYQDHSPRFAGNIHCEAAANNPEALWLCEKGLQGQEIKGSLQGDNYKTFLLAGTKGNGTFATCPENAVCDSNYQITACTSGYCRKDDACAPCDYAGMEKCRHMNSGCFRKTFGENASCTGTCHGSTFSGESVCNGVNGGSCSSTPAAGSTIFTENSACTNNATCYGVTFSGESKCDGVKAYVYCSGTVANGPTIFTDNAQCVGKAVCGSAIFSGNSVCTSTDAKNIGGCSSSSSVSTFKDNAVCAGSGCSTANYEGDNACCAGSSCPTGHVRKCVYNANQGVYERVGYWDDQI